MLLRAGRRRALEKSGKDTVPHFPWGPRFRGLALFIAGLTVAVNSYAASISEMATEEQLRSATCALAEMPDDAKRQLVGATRKYLDDKDGVELTKAFQIEEVPFYLSKCFQVHALMTMRTRESKQDFFHFYDASERYMRLLLFIEVAKSSGADKATVKKMRENAREQIFRLNSDYY